VESGHIRVTRGPKENRFRPSIDVLFRSAARSYDPQVIGVVLTGLLDDGASGLYAVKEQSGKGVVQNQPLPQPHVCI
jgi:two-component system chemotaxis response regulator CheB